MKKILIALSLLTSFFAIAVEHDMSNISGPGVELKSYDHAIAGALNGFLVFGNIDEAKGQSILTVKKDGGLASTTFEVVSGRGFGGKLVLESENGTNEVEVLFKKLDRTQNIYTYSVNGELIDIKVEADDFINNHFINPKYSTIIKNKPFSFKIESGSACYNMSAHLIAMMITAASL